MMKKLFSSIPLKRLVVYFIFLSLTPVFLVIYHFSSLKKEQGDLREKIDHIRLFAMQKEQKQTLNNVVKKLYSNADSLYLDQSLETLSFLKKEKESLEHLFQNKTFTGNEAAESRYHYIVGEANRLQFTQVSHLAGDNIQETVEVLVHPVEADGNDIKEILARIEGRRPKQPQLIITDFKLLKKSPLERNEVYELHLKLLKREFLSS